MSAAIYSLADVLRDPRIWRGRAAQEAVVATHATGHALLDAVLPGGGWPKSALSEVLIDADGIGELSLVLPTVAALTARERGDAVLVAPPYVPNPAALARRGVTLARLHIVDATPVDALWAAEQCLRSGACGIVLCWPQRANDRALRRLQVACETGSCVGIAFRPATAAANPSPAAVRVHLALRGDTVTASVLKCRGANPPGRPVVLDRRVAH